MSTIVTVIRVEAESASDATSILKAIVEDAVGGGRHDREPVPPPSSVRVEVHNSTHSEIGSMSTRSSVDQRPADIGSAVDAIVRAARDPSRGLHDQGAQAELLTLMMEIKEQATLLPQGRVEESRIRAILDHIANICQGAGGLAAAWSTWGPSLLRYFGVAPG